MRAIRPIPANYLSWDASGKLTLAASGTNQNITLTPSGTGQVAITGYRLQLTTNSGTLAPMQFVDTNTSGRTWQFGPGLGTGDVQKFTLYDVTGGAPVASFMSGGKLLLNTTTDYGALLQIGTNTNNLAGGAIFGNDTGFFRRATGLLEILGTASECGLLLTATATDVGKLETSSNSLYLSALAGSLFLRTNGTFTALTLDTSQNATFAGTAITLASASAKSGLRIPHGAAPTSPVNGDMWTTSAGLFVRINGATVGPLT